MTVGGHRQPPPGHGQVGEAGARFRRPASAAAGAFDADPGRHPGQQPEGADQLEREPHTGAVGQPECDFASLATSRVPTPPAFSSGNGDLVIESTTAATVSVNSAAAAAAPR